MPHKIKHCLAVVLGGIVLFSFQGCDQIQKFVEYLSPAQKSAVEKPGLKNEQPADQQKQEGLPQHQTAKQEKSSQQQEPLPKDVVARVGDWTITIQDFAEILTALKTQAQDFDPANIEHRQYVLGNLIQQQLLVREAERRKIDQKEDVKAQIKDARDALLVQALGEQITKEIVVSDQETEEFYNKNTENFRLPTQWHVKEIVVDSEEKAKAIAAQLNQGAAFEEIAKQSSSGKTASAGGDLGLVDSFAFEKMGQIVSVLDVGAVSGVFKGPEGYYLVKLAEKKEGDIQPLSEIKEPLKQYVLALKQQEAVYKLLAEIQAETQIDINEQLLEEKAK